MNNLVSIIIPAYNSEKTLENTVNSAINQSYENLEIIIVDDGSIDSTPNICDQIAHRYEEVKVVHVANGGAARAKNIGVSVARGEFIVIIDSDDCIEKDLVKTCLETALKSNADLIIFKFKFYKQDGTVLVLDENSMTGKVDLESKDALRCLFLDKFGPLGRNFFIKTTLFKSVRFPERTHEDGATMYRLIGQSKRIIFLPERMYKYIQYPVSMGHTYHKNDFDNLIKNNQETEEYIVNNYPDLYNYCLVYCTKVAINGLKKVFLNRSNLSKNQYSMYVNLVQNKINDLKCYRVPLGKKDLIKFFLIKYHLFSIINCLKATLPFMVKS